MARTNRRNIILFVLAIVAAAFLLVTYGTVLPSAPFVSISLDGPTSIDSDGRMTAVVDAGSRRALILNAEGDLTGVVDCTTIDAPFDAITDVCVSDGLVFLSGITFAPDSDVIELDRVATYDKGGNFRNVVFAKSGTGNVAPAIKSLNNVPGGVVIAYENQLNLTTDQDGSKGTDSQGGNIRFVSVDGHEPYELDAAVPVDTALHDIAFAASDVNRYATLSFRGVLDDDASEYATQAYAGHVFTAIDIDEDGTLYACDDETGNLYVSPTGPADLRVLVEGEGYCDVHENNGVVSLCDSVANEAKLCTTTGEVTHVFGSVRPSIGFSARISLVCASCLYLFVLALVLALRWVRRQLADGKTSSFGPIFMSVAVVAAISIAIGNLSFLSYQSSMNVRANQINAYADYLQIIAPNLSEPMEKADNRDALRGTGDQLGEAVANLLSAIEPALLLVKTANDNGVGVYYTLYGRDDKGVFYLFGSSSEHVMGTSSRASGRDGLEDAFSLNYDQSDKLMQGGTLRDAAQYRYVQIPSTDGKSVAGVIEIGSKMRSFESSIMSDLVQRILGLLVMVLVVYLGYCEIRAGGRCLFMYKQRQAKDPERMAAVLTRPFTLGITMLTSIDSVMTVLIAREMLKHAGMGESSVLLAVPAVMLGVGTVLGQSVYGVCGPRVGTRKLMVGGAFAMMLCACFTGASVYVDNFWLYCVAKLAMAVPFGMLYALGYSLPRIATDEATRALAADGVNRTNTSAAALGTVLGGYAAQALGNIWVYALVAMACIPIIGMALSFLPRDMRPLEMLAQPDSRNGHIRDLMRSPTVLAMTFFIVLPAAVAAGYSSFLFPLFSTNYGLSKSDVNNIVVLGQLVVFVCIGIINRMNAQHGRWRIVTMSLLLFGVVFLLFAVNTTLAWSVAVVVLVALLYKSSDSWKGLWPQAADAVGVAQGPATAALLATRSLMLSVQPFILGALLGATDSVAVIIIGVICAVCAGLFYLTTRHSELV